MSTPESLLIASSASAWVPYSMILIISLYPKNDLPISWVVSVDVSVDDVVATDTSVIFEVLIRQRPD